MYMLLLAADLLDDSAIVSDLSTGSSPGEFDTISSKKPRAKPSKKCYNSFVLCYINTGNVVHSTIIIVLKI